MREDEIRITPSILDRLVDFEPTNPNEAPKSRSAGLRELKQSVRRDLEWLLNTRHNADKIPEGLEELNNSLALYGLPDFTGLSSKDENDRKNLVRGLEDALRIFEPRLLNVKVLMEEIDSVRRGVRFQIQGNLQVEPIPEPVVFDTVLELGSGEFEITEK